MPRATIVRGNAASSPPSGPAPPADRGTVDVCRAHADWSRSDLGAWVGRLRRQGLHSFHQFADDDDQALVAMAIEADATTLVKPVRAGGRADLPLSVYDERT